MTYDRRLLRPADESRHICTICCKMKNRSDMQPVSDEPDRVWDVCKKCAERDGGKW